MDVVQFPERFSGQWIFLEHLKNRTDLHVLMRREVFLQVESGCEYLLFITANSFYQLFINGNLVGVGPRIHQNLGTSHIDVHDVGINLQPGKNVIAVQVYWSFDEKRSDPTLCPGMWCQLQSGTRTLLQSDSHWLVMTPGDTALAASNCGKVSGHWFVCDQRRIPENWTLPEYQCGNEWKRPDLMAYPGGNGGMLEVHPLAPGEINLETAEFKEVCSGMIETVPGFSSLIFPGNFNGRDGAAVSYIFSDSSRRLPVWISADGPVKFFCGHKLLVDGKAAGEEIELVLEKGWTRLVMFAPEVKRNTGVMLWCDNWPEELIPLNDMLDSSLPGWCVAPLQRLRFEECSFAVGVENLPGLTVFNSNFSNIPFVWDFLENSRIVKAQSKEWLAEGEMTLWELSETHYGFVTAEIIAHEGDIVDMLIGTGISSNGILPTDPCGGRREAVSCICREGKNVLRGVVPVDCSCVLILVRQTRGGVALRQLSFEELAYAFERENEFRCSEKLFNDFWQAGCATLKRSSAALYPTDGRLGHEYYLLDSFWEAVNITDVHGDSAYTTQKLRQFAGTQLENGALTALSGGKEYEQAFFHIFFLPGWIIFNYRYTSNMVEMRSLIPQLDAVKHYLVSLLDQKTGLLDAALIPPASKGENDPVVCCRLPVVMNALFCRFMISASEVYDLVERASEARECRRLLRKVSAAVISNFFDPETSMFADSPITADGEEIFSLLGNFFPLFAGMKTEECFERFVKTFFDFQSAEALTREAESPYFHWLFCEILFALGQKEWGAGYLRAYWKKRLDLAKTVWQDPYNMGTGATRFSGGCVIVPNVFLTREILGVRLAEPAHSVIYFDPAVNIVDSAEGVILTALGRIRIKWEKVDDGLEVDIFSTHQVKVLPEMPAELLKKSTFRLGEHVTLVRSAAQ